MDLNQSAHLRTSANSQTLKTACMLDMIQRVEFRANHTPNNLHKKLEGDLQEIWQDSNIFVKADKTTNQYKTNPGDYLTLVEKNVTKADKKTSNNATSPMQTKR